MMYTLKGKYAVVTFLLISVSHGDLYKYAQQQQRYDPAIPPLPWHLAPPWEYILREIILKSVTPSPPDNTNAPHKRPLDASFYGGPVAAYSNDDASVVLSRGNVYHLLNGHWMLCQDGCVDCEPCATQMNPLFRWILRRIKRLPVSDPPRHDLQLTIISQTDDHSYTSNLWPNSYVYVTSQGERAPFSIVRTQYDDDQNSSPSLENSFSEQHHRSRNLWRLTERDSIAEQDGVQQQDDRVTIQGNASTEKSEKNEKEELFEQKRRHKNMRRYRPRPAEKPVTGIPSVHSLTANSREETNQLVPKLILGTDQQGQKHLVHVVPADFPPSIAHPAILVPNNSISSQLVASQATHSNKTIPKREKQTYFGWIFRRIFDSLNTHRQSIENFLESPADNVDAGHGISLSDNMEVAGFSWNNRDASRTSADSDTTRPADVPSSRFHVENDGRMEKHRQYGNRYGYEDTNQNINYYSEFHDMNPGKILRNQEPMDWGRERRRTRIKPYFALFVNNTRQNIPRTDSSILSQSSNNSSIEIIPEPSSNGFVMNSVIRIDLNDTSVDKAFMSGNNSMEPSSITIDRENGQLFSPERLENGDANRQVGASHRPFRIIVTTESSVIGREHESLNGTKTLQMETSKTSVGGLQLAVNNKK